MASFSKYFAMSFSDTDTPLGKPVSLTNCSFAFSIILMLLTHLLVFMTILALKPAPIMFVKRSNPRMAARINIEEIARLKNFLILPTSLFVCFVAFPGKP